MFFELSRDWMNSKVKLLLYKKLMNRPRIANVKIAVSGICAFKTDIGSGVEYSMTSVIFMKNGAVSVVGIVSRMKFQNREAKLSSASVSCFSSWWICRSSFPNAVSAAFARVRR